MFNNRNVTILSQVAVKALRFLPSADDIRVSGICSPSFILEAELNVVENPSRDQNMDEIKTSEYRAIHRRNSEIWTPRDHLSRFALDTQWNIDKFLGHLRWKFITDIKVMAGEAYLSF